MNHQLVSGCLLVLAAFLVPTLAASAEPHAPTTTSTQAFISTRLMNHFMARDVVDQTAMRERILNAWTEGTQATRGTLTVRTLPSAGHAEFELILSGQSRCAEGVSRRGPVTVLSDATTAFDARARLSVADHVLNIDSINANSNTEAQLVDIQARRVLEPLARRRANQKLPQVEQAASDRYSERVSERLRGEVTQLVKTANDILAQKVRAPMLANNAWPRLHFASTESGVKIEASPSTEPAPGTRTVPPQRPENVDFFLCVHDAFLEQVAERMLGGREITDVQVLQAVEMLAGAAPRHLWVHDRSERWSVVLAFAHPLRVSFRDDAISVVVELQELSRGDQRIAAPARISATFKARPTSDGLVLVRQGEVGVEMLTPASDIPELESHKAFLLRKFGGIFPGEFHFDALAPPAGGFGEKFRRVQPQSIIFENGWGAISYEIQGTR